MKSIKKELVKRIPTLEAAYAETGYPKVDFSVYPENLRKHRKASYDAIVLVEAARKIERENGSGEIDWDNFNQRKYIPWFVMPPSAFRFYAWLYVFTGATAGSGSRLHVLTEEAAAYLGKTFVEIWKSVQLD